MTQQAIVRVASPEVREYARYVAEIALRARRLTDLRAGLESLQVALARFEAEYHARVGVLFVDLDRTRLAVAEYERRIAGLTADAAADPADIERRVEGEFSARREEVRAEEAETRRQEREFRREQARPVLDADAEIDIKDLYRTLARRFHPDLARTEEERRRRGIVMRRVNAAFRDRDVEGLRAISREQEVEDPSFEARPLGDRLVWAIREVARLDGAISDLEAQLAACRMSDTHDLWTRATGGEDVMERLDRDLRAQVAVERERLAVLVATYRGLVEARVG